ncbi:MAG: hydrogenase formation protein HypD, partial [Bdellovibrionales bacterium]|nr:hydrogenase formation protein HypD [Bdellovibrionales bacterium]
AAGHVCTVMGAEEYRPIVNEYKVPIVITGFEPLDLVQGIRMVVEQLESGRADLENQYTRSVAEKGNHVAKEAIERVFHPVNQSWRGLGEYEGSGLGLRPEFALYDAWIKFDIHVGQEQATHCLAGEIMMGIKKPQDCSHFGRDCVPDQPMGAPMVSSEGACAAYFKYALDGKGELSAEKRP